MGENSQPEQEQPTDTQKCVEASSQEPKVIVAPVANPSQNSMRDLLVGAVLSAIVIMGTDSWSFMRDQTFGTIQAERDHFRAEHEALEKRHEALVEKREELHDAKPIRARYGPTLYRYQDFDISGREVAEMPLGVCASGTCISIMLGRIDRKDEGKFLAVQFAGSRFPPEANERVIEPVALAMVRIDEDGGCEIRQTTLAFGVGPKGYAEEVFSVRVGVESGTRNSVQVGIGAVANQDRTKLATVSPGCRAPMTNEEIADVQERWTRCFRERRVEFCAE